MYKRVVVKSFVGLWICLLISAIGRSQFFSWYFSLGKIRTNQTELAKAKNPASLDLRELDHELAYVRELQSHIAYPNIPSVYELSLSKVKPERIDPVIVTISSGLADPILEEARNLKVFADFKYVSDLNPKNLKGVEKLALETRSIWAALLDGSPEPGKRGYLRTWIDGAYNSVDDLEPWTGLPLSHWAIHTGDHIVDQAFFYTEQVRSRLLRNLKPNHGNSYLPTPYPVLVPGGRFSEYYNWDTFFGVEGLLATGEIEIAQMQVENALSEIHKFGFVPNGGRDYYLTRSQPPMLSSMIKNVYEASVKRAKGDSAELLRLKNWLIKRAYPLIASEYQNFWMNPNTRFDCVTGLNHHWDEVNLPRPERHGADQELELGKTYRDVRAAAESGLDFTVAFQGEASRIGGVLLNSILGKVELDLAWMSKIAGETQKAVAFRKAFERRRVALNHYLWNPEIGRYENYNLRTGKRVGMVSADTFAPLYARLASSQQAKRVHDAAQILEKAGGIMASEATESPYQWDGNNGWAPFQFFAIQGLSFYGYRKDAKRIARKWVMAQAKVFHESGTMFERIDVEKIAKPVEDGTKYNPQPDFLWSIGTYQWAVVEVLGYPLEESKSNDQI